MSLQRISKHIASLQRVTRISRQLLASGLFKPKDYCDLIPGLAEKPIKAYVHVIRHGIRHSAFLSRDPLEAWLLPEIISKRISGREARKISAEMRRGDSTSSKKVNITDYRCTATYLRADFNGCLEILAQTSPDYCLKFCHQMLRGPFTSNDVKPFMDIIHERFEGGLWQDDIDSYKIYRDLCIADGRSLREIAGLTRAMTELANRHPNASNFYLGFQATSHAPVTAKIDQSYGDYALLQDLAAQNALKSEDFLAVRKTRQGWERVTAEDQNTDKQNFVTVSIPPPEVWVNSSRFAKTVKKNFKGLLRLLGNRAIIIPVLFPYARDITHMELPCERLISYHTFASGREGILHYKESPFKGLCVFDELGYSGAARAATIPSILDNKSASPSPSIIRYRDLHKKGQLSKYTQASSPLPAAAVQKENQKHILIALQISDDSASRWHHMSAVDMVRACAEAAQDKAVSILIKPHPKDNFQHFSDSLKMIAKDQPNIELTHGSLEALLQKADLVITANSGVGLEALLYGKAVITTGLSEYRPASLYAPDSESLKAAVSKILHGQTLNEDFQWLNAFFETHLWNGRDQISQAHIISNFINSI